MPIIIDISKDIRFIEGRKLGKKQGRKKGRKEMCLFKDQNFVVNILQNGIVSLETVAVFADVKLAFVEKTNAAYMSALALLKKGKKTPEAIAKQTGLMLEVVEKIKKNLKKE